ncbi:cytochrome P450 3A31-like [Palaemon carinicauda]|uniref:cytochrome P450 3A31-like n=1 Tax=Palaemon carinicauda TaxID=392227 RepID=UPI0035B576E7
MAVFYILLTVVLILLSYWLWKRHLRFQKFIELGIPGPTPHWFLGHLLEVNYREGRVDPIQVKEQWLKKYGKVVGYFNGLIPNVLIADLDLLRQILIKDFTTFTNRALTSTNSNMLVSMQDQKWKDVRKLMTPVFSSSKMKMMMPLMRDCVEVFLKKCDELAESKEEFNAHYELQCLTLDVIDRCAMALDLNCIQNPTNPIIDRIRKVFSSDMSLFFELVFTLPEFARYLAPLRKFSNFVSTQEFVIGHIDKVISRRKENPEMYSRQDALQLLMDATDPTSDSKTKLTEREVVENAYLFVLAGYETTSNALSYAIHLLSVHPETQDLIEREVREACGDELPSYEDLAKLPYTEAVMCESMRMYPPITSFVTRKASSDIVYEGMKIPKGMFVEASVWSIHHDEDIYPDPHTFKPERFLPENKQNYHPLAFLPFGAGPRNCIGTRFAMMESKLALASIVSKFIINPTSRTKDPLPTITRRAITNPRDGVWITLARR